MLSLHFEAGRCRVRCPFCYLGQRQDAVPDSGDDGGGGDEGRGDRLAAFAAQAAAAVARLPYREVAVTLSEPFEQVLPALAVIAAAATARGVPLSITTTVAGARHLCASEAEPWAPALWQALRRLSVSIDPFKAPIGERDDAAALAALTQELRRGADQRAGRPVTLTLIVTLSQRRFAEQLIDEGLLAALVDLPAVDQVALNALKPPPPFCDRRFWLRAMSKLGPLIRRELDRRLFLDCYVAARILGLGGCPGRPDLSPAPATPNAPAPALPLAYRACVYQPAPDLITSDLADVERRLAHFHAPSACPFPIV